MNKSIEDIIGQLPPKEFEVIKNVIETLESDYLYAEEKYKSLLEASKFQVVIQDTTPKKPKSLYDRREVIRAELVDKLLEVARVTSIKSEVIEASKAINTILEGK